MSSQALKRRISAALVLTQQAHAPEGLRSVDGGDSSKPASTTPAKARGGPNELTRKPSVTFATAESNGASPLRSLYQAAASPAGVVGPNSFPAASGPASPKVEESATGAVPLRISGVPKTRPAMEQALDREFDYCLHGYSQETALLSAALGDIAAKDGRWFDAFRDHQRQLMAYVVEGDSLKDTLAVLDALKSVAYAAFRTVMEAALPPDPARAQVASSGAEVNLAALPLSGLEKGKAREDNGRSFDVGCQGVVYFRQVVDSLQLSVVQAGNGASQEAQKAMIAPLFALANLSIALQRYDLALVALDRNITVKTALGAATGSAQVLREKILRYVDGLEGLQKFRPQFLLSDAVMDSFHGRHDLAVEEGKEWSGMMAMHRALRRYWQFVPGLHEAVPGSNDCEAQEELASCLLKGAQAALKAGLVVDAYVLFENTIQVVPAAPGTIEVSGDPQTWSISAAPLAVGVNPSAPRGLSEYQAGTPRPRLEELRQDALVGGANAMAAMARLFEQSRRPNMRRGVEYRQITAMAASKLESAIELAEQRAKRARYVSGDIAREELGVAALLLPLSVLLANAGLYDEAFFCAERSMTVRQRHRADPSAEKDAMRALLPLLHFNDAQALSRAVSMAMDDDCRWSQTVTRLGAPMPTASRVKELLRAAQSAAQEQRRDAAASNAAEALAAIDRLAERDPTLQTSHEAVQLLLLLGQLHLATAEGLQPTDFRLPPPALVGEDAKFEAAAAFGPQRPLTTGETAFFTASALALAKLNRAVETATRAVGELRAERETIGRRPTEPTFTGNVRPARAPCIDDLDPLQPDHSFSVSPPQDELAAEKDDVIAERGRRMAEREADMAELLVQGLFGLSRARRNLQMNAAALDALVRCDSLRRESGATSVSEADVEKLSADLAVSSQRQLVAKLQLLAQWDDRRTSIALGKLLHQTGYRLPTAAELQAVLESERADAEGRWTEELEEAAQSIFHGADRTEFLVDVFVSCYEPLCRQAIASDADAQLHKLQTDQWHYIRGWLGLERHHEAARSIHNEFRQALSQAYLETEVDYQSVDLMQKFDLLAVSIGLQAIELHEQAARCSVIQLGYTDRARLLAMACLCECERLFEEQLTLCADFSLASVAAVETESRAFITRVHAQSLRQVVVEGAPQILDAAASLLLHRFQKEQSRGLLEFEVTTRGSVSRLAQHGMEQLRVQQAQAWRRVLLEVEAFEFLHHHQWLMVQRYFDWRRNQFLSRERDRRAEVETASRETFERLVAQQRESRQRTAIYDDEESGRRRLVRAARDSLLRVLRRERAAITILAALKELVFRRQRRALLSEAEVSAARIVYLEQSGRRALWFEFRQQRWDVLAWGETKTLRRHELFSAEHQRRQRLLASETEWLGELNRARHDEYERLVRDASAVAQLQKLRSRRTLRCTVDNFEESEATARFSLEVAETCTFQHLLDLHTTARMRLTTVAEAKANIEREVETKRKSFRKVLMSQAWERAVKAAKECDHRDATRRHRALPSLSMAPTVVLSPEPHPLLHSVSAVDLRRQLLPLAPPTVLKRSQSLRDDPSLREPERARAKRPTIHVIAQGGPSLAHGAGHTEQAHESELPLVSPGLVSQGPARKDSGTDPFPTKRALRRNTIV